MILLVVIAVLSTAVWGYALVHVLRHDPRTLDAQPPRSHHHEIDPTAWHATGQPGRWVA